MTPASITTRLDYLRGEIEAETISYAEIAELQSLADFIDSGDTVLREWSGLPEHLWCSKAIETKVQVYPTIYVMGLPDAVLEKARCCRNWAVGDETIGLTYNDAMRLPELAVLLKGLDAAADVIVSK